MENDPVELWTQNMTGMPLKFDLCQLALAQCSKMHPRGGLGLVSGAAGAGSGG